MLLGLYTKLQTAWVSFRSRFEDETGAVATEYVLLLVLIALAITGGMIYLATQINAMKEAGNKFIISPCDPAHGAFPAGKKYALSHWAATVDQTSG